MTALVGGRQFDWLAVGAENVASNVTKNPAGVIAGLLVEQEDGTKTSLGTDAHWNTELPGRITTRTPAKPC